MKFKDIDVYNNLIISLTEEIDILLKPTLQEQVIPPSPEYGGDEYGDEESEEEQIQQHKDKKEWKDPLIYQGNKWDESLEMTDAELRSVANPLNIVKLTANDLKSIEQMNTRGAVIGFRLEHPDYKGKIIIQDKIEKIKIGDKSILEILVTAKAARTIKLPTLVSDKTPGYCYCVSLVNEYDNTGSDSWSTIKTNMKNEIKNDSKANQQRIKNAMRDCEAAFGNSLTKSSNRNKLSRDCDTYENFLNDIKSASGKLEGLLGQFYRIKNKKSQQSATGRTLAGKLASYKKIIFKNTSGGDKQASDSGSDCCMNKWGDDKIIEISPTGSVGGGAGKTIKAKLTGSIKLIGSTDYVLITFQHGKRTDSQTLELMFRNSSGARTGNNLSVTGHITSLS